MLALMPTAASAGEFYVLGTTPKGLEFVDIESIRQSGEVTTVTAPIILKSPESFYGGRLVRRYDYRYALDCQTRSFQVTGFDLFSGQGELLSANDVKSEWGRPNPGSLGALLLRFACDKFRPGDNEGGRYTDLASAQTAFYATLQTDDPQR